MCTVLPSAAASPPLRTKAIDVDAELPEASSEVISIRSAKQAARNCFEVECEAHGPAGD